MIFKNKLILFLEFYILMPSSSMATTMGNNNVPENESGDFVNGERTKRAARLRRPPQPIQLRIMHNELKSKFETLEQASSDWLNEAWDMMNAIRFEHQKNTFKYMQLDYELAYDAQLWAIELGKRSGAENRVILEHDNKVMWKYGELMGARKVGTREQLESLPGSFPVRIWHSELENHDWEDNIWKWNTGHMSQIIWENTRYVGCGRYITGDKASECEGGKWVRQPILIMVCRFSPPGNWKSKKAYEINVYPPFQLDRNGSWDYSEMCYENEKKKGTYKCDKPHVCCTPKSKPVPFVLPCSGE